jgi:peptidoglycan/xylan/chitin deacetylase (PgdA/CDA1 family)
VSGGLLAAGGHTLAVSGLLHRRAFLAGALATVAGVAGCSRADRVDPSTPTRAAATAARPRTSSAASSPARPRPPVSTRPRDVAARATVPVLCWHQLRDWTAGDSAYDRASLICPPAAFRRQLDALAAGGWTTISADQYLAHLTTGAALPPRPVLLSFDDSQGSQISVGLPELTRRRMTATFFVMTVPLDKPRWMSRADLRRLVAAGMTVGAHTWDHQRADRYSGADWKRQLDEPKAELERVVRRPVRHFAYPYGLWTPADFPHLAAAGYRTAFTLDGHADPRTPLYTLPRILVHSEWTGPDLVNRLRQHT